jgi:hypothetical protein
MPPDPKAGKRIVDPDALRRARARGDECAACGGPASNAHHVIQRGAPHFGDDVVENLILFCGSGTEGCHGAFHGTPYVAHLKQIGGEPRTERRDRAWVARRAGNFMLRQRPDVIVYVIEKLGLIAGCTYLEREYLMPRDHAVACYNRAA